MESGAMRWIGRHWKKLLVLAAIPIALICAANLWVLARGSAHVYFSTKTLPQNRVGLVLGTSPHLRGGGENPFFAGRVSAAAELFKAGKVRHLLLSGDNRTRQYDEPTEMKLALLAKGVPARAMTLDYAGLRTLDSLVRAKEVFGLRELTVITDDFHAPRAVFLARHYGIDAAGFCSRRVPWAWSKKTRIRELASRVVACLDVYLLDRQPRFLGKKEKVAVE
jgi:SanA protein